MDRHRAHVVLAAVGVCVLAACSGGPTISNLTVRQTDPLCVDFVPFQAKAAALEAASVSGDLATVRSDVAAVSASLDALVTDAAKLPDKVNGHFVKDDLTVAAGTYAALKAALVSAKDGDPNALSAALASVQDKEGQAFTSSTARLDAYTKKACGSIVGTPTTVAPATTTSPVVGPVGPTTSAGPTASTTTVTPAGPTTTTVPVPAPVTTAAP